MLRISLPARVLYVLYDDVSMYLTVPSHYAAAHDQVIQDTVDVLMGVAAGDHAYWQDVACSKDSTHYREGLENWHDNFAS